MKLKLLLYFVLFSCTLVKAQDLQYSQFYASPLHVNPAFTGATLEHRLSSNYRLQWPKIGGKFKNYNLSYDYNANDINTGFGFIANREEIGNYGLVTTTLALSVAHRIQIKRKLFLMAGAKFGFGFRKIDYSKLLFNDQLETGNSVSGDQYNFANQNVTYPDLSAGLLLYSPKYWFGFSANHLNQPDQSLLKGDRKSQLSIKYSMQGGYVFALNGSSAEARDINKLTAAFQYKSQDKYDQFDLGFYYSYDPIVIGLWYRGLPIIKDYEKNYPNNEAIIALVGYNIPSFDLRIGYSYDITISNLIGNTGGAHEITMVYEVASCKKRLRKRKFIIPCAKF